MSQLMPFFGCDHSVGQSLSLFLGGGFNPSALWFTFCCIFLLRHMCVCSCLHFREKECYAIFMNATATAADLIAVSRKII